MRFATYFAESVIDGIGLGTCWNRARALHRRDISGDGSDDVRKSGNDLLHDD